MDLGVVIGAVRRRSAISGRRSFASGVPRGESCLVIPEFCCSHLSFFFFFPFRFNSGVANSSPFLFDSILGFSNSPILGWWAGRRHFSGRRSCLPC